MDTVLAVRLAYSGLWQGVRSATPLLPEPGQPVVSHARRRPFGSNLTTHHPHQSEVILLPRTGRLLSQNLSARAPGSRAIKQPSHFQSHCSTTGSFSTRLIDRRESDASSGWRRRSHNGSDLNPSELHLGAWGIMPPGKAAGHWGRSLRPSPKSHIHLSHAAGPALTRGWLRAQRTGRATR